MLYNVDKNYVCITTRLVVGVHLNKFHTIRFNQGPSLIIAFNLESLLVENMPNTSLYSHAR